MSWLRPNRTCPECGKGGAVFVDPQLARLIHFLIYDYAVEGPALSVKCVRCRTVYSISLADIGELAEDPN